MSRPYLVYGGTEAVPADVFAARLAPVLATGAVA